LECFTHDKRNAKENTRAFRKNKKPKYHLPIDFSKSGYSKNAVKDE